MNLCVFNIEAVHSLHNEDYSPSRLHHVLDSIRHILKTNYFPYYAVILSTNPSTVLIPPTTNRFLVESIATLKTTAAAPHHLRSLRQSLLVIRQAYWDSVHIVSYVSTEESLSDTLLRPLEFLALRNFHVQFVLLGDVLPTTSHTRLLLRGLAARQGRIWGTTELDLRKATNAHDRLLMRLSEGIVISKQHKNQNLVPHMKAGQDPSEFKSTKRINCRIISYTVNDTVLMIPIPLISQHRVVTTARCGKCVIDKGQCVSTRNVGLLVLLELTPVLFKIGWKGDDGSAESITFIHGEASAKTFVRNECVFLVVECRRGTDRFCQHVYWTMKRGQHFADRLNDVMTRPIPPEYSRLMDLVYVENKRTLSRMQERLTNTRKEKGILNKVDQFPKAEMKPDVDRIVKNEVDKKPQDEDPVN